MAMTMAEPAFVLDRVTKSYHVWHRLRRRPARGLDRVSLEVPKGIIFGLLGLNGAGKTTAMRILVGLLKPDAGSVRVLGGSPGDAGIRARIGYLPELPYLPNMMSARDLMGHYARMGGLAGRHVDNQVLRALDAVGLAGRSDDRLRQYSKGMLQRAAMAQMLLHEPDVLLIDEPMSGLDPRGTAEMRSLLAGLRERGVTILLNSHQIPEVERLCDRVGIMAEGRLVREGTVGEILSLARTRRYRVTLLVRRGGRWGIEDRSVPEHGLAALLASGRRRGSRVLQILAEQGNLEEVLLEAVTRAR